MFRVTEITARQLMFVLMWIVIGEYFVMTVIIINFVHDAGITLTHSPIDPLTHLFEIVFFLFCFSAVLWRVSIETVVQCDWTHCVFVSAELYHR